MLRSKLLSKRKNRQRVSANDVSSDENRSSLDEPRLKICVLAACPFPANHGTPGSIRELVEATAERGHEIHVVTYHIGEKLAVSGATIHRIPRWTAEQQVVVGPTLYRPLYDFQMIFKTLEVMWRYKCDLMHAHGYESALVAACCRPFVRRPVIYSAHNRMGDELASYDFFRSRIIANALAWLLDRYVPRIGDRCIPHSANLQRFLFEGGLVERCEKLLNFGINVEHLSAEHPSDVRARYGLGSDPIILYSGVIDRFQRLDLLLGAMPLVLKSMPRAKLLLVVTVPNDNQERILRSEATRLGIEANVQWIYPSAMDEAMQMLPACDVAVVPRPGAPGFPIKLLNYMAAKRPCVMFRSSASNVVHGEHVYLAEDDTSESFAKGLIQLLGNEHLRARLATEAYRFVCKHHDRRIVAANLCQAYVRLLQGTKHWGRISQRQTPNCEPGHSGLFDLDAPLEPESLEASAHATA